MSSMKDDRYEGRKEGKASEQRRERETDEGRKAGQSGRRCPDPPRSMCGGVDVRSRGPVRVEVLWSACRIVRA
jgi:hypothetical protein